MSRHPKAPPIFPAPWANEWGEDEYGLWMALTYKEIRYVFRWIEPGDFMMGSPEDEKGRYDDEDLHSVEIKEGFWLGEFPVTQALYQAVMGENPSEFQKESNSPELPVENMSWHDAQAFIKTLNQAHSALNAYLPLEAQWEYACRAGTKTAFWFGDDIDLNKVNYSGKWELDLKDRFSERALQKTSTLGTYPVNPWGLYDMHGNVWEWCLDVWQEHLGVEAQGINTGEALINTQQTALALVDKDEAQKFALRGGSWALDGRGCRSAIRNSAEAGPRSRYIGFRLSLGPELQ